MKAAYAEAGIKAEENGTYHLHPVTMGMHYAQQFPEKVLCVELNRGPGGGPVHPLRRLPISPAKVEQDDRAHRRRAEERAPLGRLPSVPGRRRRTIREATFGGGGLHFPRRPGFWGARRSKKGA